MVVQFVPSLEVWTWKARAYAASQFSTTRLMVCVAPRSTRTHCGSLNALDQRVPVLPSNALPAGKEAFSVDDAVAGRPWARLLPAGGVVGGVVVPPPLL